MKHRPIAEIREKSILLPKIWADGEHDDLPGVVAAMRNELVEYAGEIVEPNCDISVIGTVRLSHGIIVVGPDAPEQVPEPSYFIIRNDSPGLGRTVSFEGVFVFDLKVAGDGTEHLLDSDTMPVIRIPAAFRESPHASNSGGTAR